MAIASHLEVRRVVAVVTIAIACRPTEKGADRPEDRRDGANVGAPATSAAAGTPVYREVEPVEAGFIFTGSGPRGHLECSITANDCASGEKCNAWSNDGGAQWNASRCSPIFRDAKPVGSACKVEGSGVSGIDDCVAHAMCWAVDSAGRGRCVMQCAGTDDAPHCPNACETCLERDGVPMICLPGCVPPANGCAAGEGCYPDGDRFVCLPDASGPKTGSTGDACTAANTCDPGLFCSPSPGLPACGTAERCCLPGCEPRSQPDPCARKIAGSTCAPLGIAPGITGCREQVPIGVCARR